MKLSVVIPSKNEGDNLRDCITEIVQSLIDHNIENEILVIDDGSTDNTAKIIKDLKIKFPSVNYVLNEGENGFGRAVRLGL